MAARFETKLAITWRAWAIS